MWINIVWDISVRKMYDENLRHWYIEKYEADLQTNYFTFNLVLGQTHLHIILHESTTFENIYLFVLIWWNQCTKKYSAILTFHSLYENCSDIPSIWRAKQRHLGIISLRYGEVKQFLIKIQKTIYFLRRSSNETT